jgi:hypothetical protein
VLEIRNSLAMSFPLPPSLSLSLSLSLPLSLSFSLSPFTEDICIRGAVVFSEQVDDGGSTVAHPPGDQISSSIVIPVVRKKNEPLRLRVQYLLGNPTA